MYSKRTVPGAASHGATFLLLQIIYYDGTDIIGLRGLYTKNVLFFHGNLRHALKDYTARCRFCDSRVRATQNCLRSMKMCHNDL